MPPLGAVSGSVLTAGLAVQILAFGAAPGMGMYPAGGGGRLGDAGPGGVIGLGRRRSYPGVVLDVLLELGPSALPALQPPGTRRRQGRRGLLCCRATP